MICLHGTSQSQVRAVSAIERVRVVAEFAPQIVKTGLDKLFEVTREKDQASLITILIALQTRGALSADQLLAGIRKSTDQLEDLRLVPFCHCQPKVDMVAAVMPCALVQVDL